MRICKEDIPVKIDAPGAVARQQIDFGSAGGEVFGAEYFSLGAGADLAPLLQGLEGDLCQSPHWGHLISGEVVVTYTDGSSETCVDGDLFHWPPGHTVRAERDTEVVLFSPQDSHTVVMDHILAKMAMA